jgi:Flp pilus assembly protein TadD
VQHALPHLKIAAATDAVDEDAHYQLAAALDRAGELAAARAEYDRVATAHPQSPFTPIALRRSAALARAPAQP